MKSTDRHSSTKGAILAMVYILLLSSCQSYYKAVPAHLSGSDVAGMDTGGQYKILHHSGLLRHHIDLFPASGYKRSVFLHNRGYYEPVRAYNHAPNLSYAKTLTKPGAPALFSRERYADLIEQYSQMTGQDIAVARGYGDQRNAGEK